MKKWNIMLLVMMVIAILVAVGCAPAAPPVPTATPTPDTSAGKSIVGSRCISCHPLAHVQAARYDRAGWEATVQMMVNRGAQLGQDDQKLAVDYLVSAFPKE
jgi:mono/diheme cytochrome c family protein